MDDNFGEIIYIIVMVAIFIFSALKKKKAPGENIPEKEVPNPMDEIFSPFEELLNPEKEDESPKTERSQPTHSVNEAIKNYPFIKEDYVFTANTSPEDIRRKRKNKSSSRQAVLKSDDGQPVNQATSAEHPFKRFDLKKAVIYSEILKRPDY